MKIAFRGKRARALLCSTVLALVAVSATGYPAAAQSGPKRGGTLTVILSQELASLDSAAGLIAESPRYVAIYGGLVTLDYPSSKVEMGQAKSLTTPDGGKTWDLTLRPGLKFSDGTAFDAAAVKYNWDRIMKPATRSVQIAQIQQMKSYTVTAPLTLRVVLRLKNTQFPLIVADGIGWIGSPTAMEKLGPDFASKPVGGGPFVVDHWTRNSELVLKRNPTYFDSPRPYINTLRLRPIVDESQAANTFQSGAAQIAYSISDLAPQRFKGGGSIVTAPRMGGTGLGMDITKAPFNDIRIRRAVAMAIDPQAVTNAGSPGGRVSRSLLPKSNPAYAPGQDWPKTDRAAAQKLVDAYRKDHGGDEIKVTYEIVDTPSLRTEAEAVQAQLNRLDGFHVDVRGLPTPQYLTKLQTKTMAFGSWAITGSWVEPVFYNQFYSGVARNYFHYLNPKVDAELNRARTLTDYNAQLKAYQAVGSMVAADLPIFLTRHITAYYGLAKSVKGFELAWDGWPDYTKVWLN